MCAWEVGGGGGGGTGSDSIKWTEFGRSKLILPNVLKGPALPVVIHGSSHGACVTIETISPRDSLIEWHHR